jgi:hypothetical protein
MRLDEAPAFPRADQGIVGWVPSFLRSLTAHMVRVAQQVNLLTEGKISAAHAAATAAPTAGEWVQGDVVRNSAPAEAGSGGSKYVITGWVCTVSGSPGTWVETRSLTGN